MEYLKILLHNISFSLCDCFWICPEKKNFNLVIEDEEYFFPPSLNEGPAFCFIAAPTMVTEYQVRFNSFVN